MNKRAVEASDDIRPIPDLRTGDIIELKMVFMSPIIVIKLVFLLHVKSYDGVFM